MQSLRKWYLQQCVEHFNHVARTVPGLSDTFCIRLFLSLSRFEHKHSFLTYASGSAAQSISDEFTKQVVELAKGLRQGPPLDSVVDCGAMCMPAAAKGVQALVDDAVAKVQLITVSSGSVNSIRWIQNLTFCCRNASGGESAGRRKAE